MKYQRSLQAEPFYWPICAAQDAMGCDILREVLATLSVHLSLLILARSPGARAV